MASSYSNQKQQTELTVADQNRYSSLSTSVNKLERFERTRGADYKPFKFPSESSELLRRIRWPSDLHSNHHAFDAEAKSAPSRKTLVVFPPLESKLLMPTEHKKDESSILPEQFSSLSTDEIKEINGQANGEQPPSIHLNSSVNNESGVNGWNNIGVDNVNVDSGESENKNDVVNKTVIANGFEPLIYIDDNGIFQIKYSPVRKNGTSANENESGDGVLVSLPTSINKTIENVMIILNGENSTAGQRVPATFTNGNIMNGTMTPDLNEMHTKDPSSSRFQTQQHHQQHQPQQSNSSNHNRPALFNGLPIFVK